MTIFKYQINYKVQYQIKAFSSLKNSIYNKSLLEFRHWALFDIWILEFDIKKNNSR